MTQKNLTDIDRLIRITFLSIFGTFLFLLFAMLILGFKHSCSTNSKNQSQRDSLEIEKLKTEYWFP